MPSRSLSARLFGRRFAWGVIVLSAVLRVLLALQGGQYFFGDEGRFDRGARLYEALLKWDNAGVQEVLAFPDHTLFPWIAAGATAVQHLFAQFTPYGHWSRGAPIIFTIPFGAAALSLFSAVNLFLFYRVARKIGAEEEEAGWGLLLMAAANTNFYFSRHLLPYDAAMSVALLALWLGRQGPGKTLGFSSGFVAGLTYHIYNGYWYLVPVLGLGYYFARRATKPPLSRCAIWIAGAVLGLGLPIAVGLASDGERYVTTMRAFSRTVTQGAFAEGWSLPWEYLWHSEGCFGLGVMAAIVASLEAVRRQGLALPGRVRASLLLVGGAYFLLVLFSVGLQQFVVYARTLKPLVVFLCLLGGWGISTSLKNRPILSPLVFVAICLAAAAHFAPHFTRIFPRELELTVLKQWGYPKHTLSVSGSLYSPLDAPLTRPDLVLVNAQLLYPVRGKINFPAGETVFRVTHPLSYLPFQYESHTPRERALLRDQDISVRLIKLAAPESVPRDLPIALRFTSEDRSSGR